MFLKNIDIVEGCVERKINEETICREKVVNEYLPQTLGILSPKIHVSAVVSWAGAQTWLQPTGGGDTQGFDSSSAAFYTHLHSFSLFFGNKKIRTTKQKNKNNKNNHALAYLDHARRTTRTTRIISTKPINIIAPSINNIKKLH